MIAITERERMFLAADAFAAWRFVERRPELRAAIVAAGEPVTFDEIAGLVGLPVEEVTEALWDYWETAP